MSQTPNFDLSHPWDRAILTLQLLAIDPSLGGLHLRARSGPVRQEFQAQITTAFGEVVPLHPTMSDDQLFGGLDLTATLSAGRLVNQDGALSKSGARVLTMAERCTPHMAARLGLALETAPNYPLILLDEGADADETAPASLCEKLAFRADLDAVSRGDIERMFLGLENIEGHRAALNNVKTPDDLEDIVTGLSLRLGVFSLRAPLFAIKAARALAAFSGRTKVETEDIETAVSLTLAHRATHMPADEDSPAPDEQPDPNTKEQNETENILPPEDMILEAALALLPADFLAKITPKNQRGATGSGSGSKRRGNRRGRPVPARPGRLDGRARLDLVSTLRAAAPWQELRRAGKEKRLRIQASDIHVKRFEVMSDRLLIFTVDASGSAALARLAEAKGAIELLLSQAYARRDHVAMVAFRGTAAEVLLPPTRSLVQAKKRLSSLPGGGGTPLALGLREAGVLAVQARQKGLTPTVILLTDGRANITLEGTPGRPQAASDAQAMAENLLTSGVEALVIDTGNRPAAALRQIAQTLSAPYLALPRADSARLSDAVSASLAG